MSFDLSCFPEVFKTLFDGVVNFFKSLHFDFGSYSISGWAVLLGVAIVSLIIYMIGRLLQ